MGMPAEQGLSVLYVLADQWLRERQMLQHLGAQDPAPFDEWVGRERVEGERDKRAALVRSLGGEVTG
jgi:hypothetical protein